MFVCLFLLQIDLKKQLMEYSSCVQVLKIEKQEMNKIKKITKQKRNITKIGIKQNRKFL